MVQVRVSCKDVLHLYLFSFLGFFFTARCFKTHVEHVFSKFYLPNDYSSLFVFPIISLYTTNIRYVQSNLELRRDKGIENTSKGGASLHQMAATTQEAGRQWP